MKYIISSVLIVIMIISILFICENVLGDWNMLTFIPSVLFLIIAIAIIQFLNTEE